jgi:nicotinate-nucleotide adenylyltransferase
MTKIAIFGSAFNPPSLGHKSVIETLQHFDKVLLVPSIYHAWGKKMLAYDKRCELLDAFISDLDIANLESCNVEEVLYEPGQPVTTYAVLEKLQRMYPESELTFVIGPDNLLNFSKFSRAEDILKKWSVLACPELVKVRSTKIREHLAQGLNVDHLTTFNVAKMLVEYKLY